MRVGLMAIKGMSRSTRQRIITRRESRPFRDLEDFFDRVRPAGDEARALTHCGALDSLAPGHSRAQMVWQWVQWQARNRSRRHTLALFADREKIPAPPALPPDDEMTFLRREFSVLGFLCRRHPMALFTRAVAAARTVKAAKLPRQIGRHVRFAGWLITGKVVRTKAGDPMEFLTFEDETGIVETTFFPKTYDRFCHLIDRGRPYLLDGKVEQNWGAATLTVSHVRPLST
jgi:DNA polymerase-3 subunit alpha/error-prone DNA polymerase